MSPAAEFREWISFDLIRELRVHEVMRRKSPGTVPVCRKDMSLTVVVKALAKSPSERNVYVIDEREKLLGQVSKSSLSRVLLFDYQPTRFFPRLIPVITAKCADDVMEPVDVAVREDHSLEEVLRRLVPTQEEECPVVDDQGRVIGCLSRGRHSWTSCIER